MRVYFPGQNVILRQTDGLRCVQCGHDQEDKSLNGKLEKLGGKKKPQRKTFCDPFKFYYHWYNFINMSWYKGQMQNDFPHKTRFDIHVVGPLWLSHSVTENER